LKYPKFKDLDNRGILYLFRDRAEFEMCVARKCKLISLGNAFDASELTFSMDLISSLAIELWRLEKRIDKTKSTISSLVLDQHQRIKDILQKYEIETREYTDKYYDDGMSVKVLHVEEVNGLAAGKKKVIETIKPSIYYRGKIISHGEVIVGKSKEKE
jgi:hypothetical protein